MLCQDNYKFSDDFRHKECLLKGNVCLGHVCLDQGSPRFIMLIMKLNIGVRITGVNIKHVRTVDIIFWDFPRKLIHTN